MIKKLNLQIMLVKLSLFGAGFSDCLFGSCANVHTVIWPGPLHVKERRVQYFNTGIGQCRQNDPVRTYKDQIHIWVHRETFSQDHCYYWIEYRKNISHG